MILSTIENMGRNYEILGVVQGSTIQSVNLVKDFGQALKTLVGGELGSYTTMMNKARQLATERMIQAASVYEADAIIGVRITSSAVMQGAAEVIVYGTAVKFKD